MTDLLADFGSLDDPDNPENRNAGNGGDLVKHTVYLAALASLAAKDLRIHECHAGRGAYRIPQGDPRRQRLHALIETELPLARAQRAALKRVGVSPVDWYAGSALLIANHGDTQHEAYEWDPSTRAILRAAAGAGGFDIDVIEDDREARFDGETHIAGLISKWGERDLVLLDPFGLWRNEKHAFRRARYRQLFEARRSCPMILFFTWGQDLRGEAADRADLDHVLYARWGKIQEVGSDSRARAQNCSDGYGGLRSAIAEPVIEVRWHCDLRCAMWLVTPGRVDIVLSALSQHLHELQAQVMPDAGIEISVLGPH